MTEPRDGVETPAGTAAGDTEPGEARAEQTTRSTPTKRVLAALFWLLASLSILVGGATLWAHQTLLTSNGWATVVSGVASDQEVIDATSARIVDRLGESLGVGDRIAEILPGESDIVANALTRVVQDKVTDGITNFASSERFQEAFVDVNRAAHDAAMKVIRGGDGEVLTSGEGAIALNVFPLVEEALVSLQDAGLIDESRKIPDLSEYQPPAQTVARLEKLLGRDLPDDIGTITLIESDRLGRVQDAARAFDVITVVLLLIALASIALALWLSGRRLRMVLWLAIGAIVALLLGRGFTRLVMDDITGKLREAEGGVAVQAVIDSSVDSLMWFTFAIIAVALVVAGIAIWAERRAAAAGDTSASVQPQSVNEWLYTRRRAIGCVGVGFVAIVVLWNVGGPDITLLAAAALGIMLIALSLLAGRPEPDETGAGSGTA